MVLVTQSGDLATADTREQDRCRTDSIRLGNVTQFYISILLNHFYKFNIETIFLFETSTLPELVWQRSGRESGAHRRARFSSKGYA